MDHRPSAPDYWDKRAVNRKEWETVINLFLHRVSAALIEQLQPLPAAHILDVATGTGEPGLTIARMLPQGFVTVTDISEKMLEIAVGKARDEGLHNFRAVRCEAAFMPFEDNTFHAIVCRNGVMFFANIAAGLREMYRVLKPGGSVAVSTWGVLDKNLWISIVLDAITTVTHHKSYNRHKPGMFYCMQPGTMTDWFETANLENIKEEEITGVVEFNSVDEHWSYVTSVSASVVDALKDVPVHEQELIRTEVERKIVSHLINDKLYFQWNMRITTGTKIER
jgi:ubiquinone/menaquinone biosynthesis C-methylase UbiE